MELLPERFGELESLTDLNLLRCDNLKSLSERFGDLKNLQKLDLRSCPAKNTMPAALKEQLKSQGCTVHM